MLVMRLGSEATLEVHVEEMAENVVGVLRISQKS